MNALPQSLAAIARGLSDAQLAEVAREASDEVLIELLRSAIDRRRAAVAPVPPAPTVAKAKPRAEEPRAEKKPAEKKSRREDARGTRPTKGATRPHVAKANRETVELVHKQLQKSGPVSGMALAEALKLSQGTVSDALSALAAAGRVSRVKHGRGLLNEALS